MSGIQNHTLRNLPDALHFLSLQILLVLFTVFMNVTCTIQYPSNLMFCILLSEVYSFSFAALGWLERLNPCPSLQTGSNSLPCRAGTEGDCLYATALNPLWLLRLKEESVQGKLKRVKGKKKDFTDFSNFKEKDWYTVSGNVMYLCLC